MCQIEGHGSAVVDTPPAGPILPRPDLARTGGRRWRDRAVGGGPCAIDKWSIRDFPAAMTIARVSDDRVVAESDLATSLLGCPSPRIGERLSKRWIARRDFEAFMTRFESTGRIDRAEVRLQRNDGTQFWCSVSARLIECEHRPHILLHMADLSEQIAALAEISRQRDALHSAEKLSALGQLLGGISHELNNPLSVLAGQALILKEKAPDAATAKRADRILDAAGRCSRIVRSFLDLARGKPSEPAAADINDIVVEATESTIDALRGAGIEAVLELPEGLPRVVVDPDQIRQVVVNLIVNARQAMAGDTGIRRIVIRTRRDAETDRVTLKVSDTGPGVSSEVSSRIFDPLFTTKGPDGGTGLGLALCRQIMEAHGGSIDLEATSARGSTFVLTFARPENVHAVGPTQRRDRRAGLGQSVLVLDDRPEAGAVLADELSADGHGVDVVESLFVGCELLRRGRYDAIFCRAGLGELSVTGCLRAIGEARPAAAASVVFVVDAGTDRAIMSVLDRLERPYLEEPFRRRDLADLLELLMSRRAASLSGNGGTNA